MKILLRFLTTFLFSTALLADFPLKVEEAWIMDGPPMMPMRAGYMSLTNTGEQTLHIRAASSPNFGNIEMHETRINDGVARMHEIHVLVLEPGQRQLFKPKGHHFMLMQADPIPRLGQTVPLTLHTSAGDLDIELLVKKR